MRRQRIAALDRLDHFFHFVVTRAATVFLGHRGRAQVADARLQLAQLSRRHMVARTFEQHVVETLHRVDHLLQLAVLQRLAVVVEGFFQGFDVLGFGAQGEQLHDQSFKYAAQLVDIDRIGEGDDRHARAFGIGELDQTFGFQVTQGFTHRRTAYTEAIAQIALDQTIAGHELEIHDRATQFIQHDFAQGNGVAIDLEAVVEWQAFHGVRSDCGCPCKKSTSITGIPVLGRIKQPRVNWRPRHRLRRRLHGRAGNCLRQRGHRNKCRPEAIFRVFAHDSGRYARRRAHAA
ncbi:hypothetical protein D3C72_1082630 [compost metagenome]